MIHAELMAHLYAITILWQLVSLLVNANEYEEARTNLRVVIPGNSVSECPSVEDRQAARQLLHTIILQNYNINPNCGPGLWRQVFYLNASNEIQRCPGDWNYHTVNESFIRCAGTPGTCQSAFSDDIHSAYDKVCGRIIGQGVDTTDAFFRPAGPTRGIEDNYLDGVSVTLGARGSRKHIWSFGAGHPPPIDDKYTCPCDASNASVAKSPPDEVQENYFCTTSYPGDRLCSGSDCNSASSCCSFHNPPYFSVQLSESTTDKVELRICTDQGANDEQLFVLFAEIYVQ